MISSFASGISSMAVLSYLHVSPMTNSTVFLAILVGNLQPRAAGGWNECGGFLLAGKTRASATCVKQCVERPP